MQTRHKLVFLNPDIIAAGIGPLDSERASFQAGRILIKDVKSRIASGSEFSFETTMSDKTWLPVLKKAKDLGYEINIYFLFTTSVEKSLERIAKRVSQGGHHIPHDAVARRYPRCFQNFWHHYRALANRWYVFDNTHDEPNLVMKDSDFASLSDHAKGRFVADFLEGKVHEL